MHYNTLFVKGIVKKRLQTYLQGLGSRLLVWLLIKLLDFLRFQNGARVAEVEEPLWAAKTILFEFEVDEVAEPKALRGCDLQMQVSRHGSFAKVAIAIGASEAFVRQNHKKSKMTKKRRSLPR